MNQAPLSPVEIATFYISKTMLHALREIYRLFDGDILMAMVLGELGQYIVSDSQTNLLPPVRPRHSNAHSISIASGIPRETVRRKLEKLIAKGWVIECPEGGLSLDCDLSPSLYLQFIDYNRELLSQMRQTVNATQGVEF